MVETHYFVTTPEGNKIYLDVKGFSDIPENFSLEYNKIDFNFTLKDVQVESLNEGADIAGAILGTFLGLIAGPLGMLIGAVIGGLIGSHYKYKKRREVKDEQERIKKLINNK